MTRTHNTLRLVLQSISGSLLGLLMMTSALAATSSSFQLYSDHPNYASPSPGVSDSFAINESGTTWRPQPSTSTSFQIITASAAAIEEPADPAPVDPTPAPSGGGGSGGGDSSGRRICPLTGIAGPCPALPSTNDPVADEALSAPSPDPTPTPETDSPAQKQAPDTDPATDPFRDIDTSTITPTDTPATHTAHKRLLRDPFVQRDSDTSGASFRPTVELRPAAPEHCPQPQADHGTIHTCTYQFPWILLLLLVIALIATASALHLYCREQSSSGSSRRKKKSKHPRHLLQSATVILISTAISALLANVSLAATTGPQTHIYNGHLLDSSGNAITTAHTIRFSYWTSADHVSGDTTGTGAINTSAATYAGWSEEHTVTPNSNGYFSVTLGSINALPDLSTFSPATLASLFLQEEVKVSGAADTSYELLDHNGSSDTVDRAALLSVPFARNADLLDRRSTGTGSGSIPVLQSGGLLRVSTIPGGTNRSTFTINADGSSDGATLQFGQTLLRTLRYDYANNRFNFDAPLRVQGPLTVTGSITIGNFTLGTGTGAGMIRWTGSDFEGFNGSSWISLTNSGGAVSQARSMYLSLRDATIVGDGSDNSVNVYAATQTGSTSAIHHYLRAATGSGQLQDIDIRL